MTRCASSTMLTRWSEWEAWNEYLIAKRFVI
jgi:hypothetical protein